MVDRVSDAAAIRASLDDPAAFRVIFDRYHARIFAYLAARVGSVEAEDLASEVFVASFQQRASFRLEASSAGPWLYGIAANKAKRHYRSLNRRQRAYARAAGRSVVWIDPDLAARVDAQREVAELAAALRSLRARDREVLLLYGLAELTYSEISEALGIPVGTVRSRISRTRDRLGNHLETKGQSVVGGTDEQGEVNDAEPRRPA